MKYKAEIKIYKNQHNNKVFNKIYKHIKNYVNLKFLIKRRRKSQKFYLPIGTKYHQELNKN